MAELINLNTTLALTDSDIPAAIARDTEFQVADAAHIAAADPHPIYLTPAEGDARYTSGILVKILTGTTPSIQNSVSQIAHGLTATKIVGMVAKVTSGTFSVGPGYLSGAAGFQFDVVHDGTYVMITTSASNSGSILNKPVKVVVFYIL